MHSSHITLALADARVAELRRAAIHSTAIRPPRRLRRAPAVLALAAVAALTPIAALAQPMHDTGTPASSRVDRRAVTARAPHMTPNQIDAVNHASSMHSLLLHQLGRDASTVASSCQ